MANKKVIVEAKGLKKTFTNGKDDQTILEDLNLWSACSVDNFGHVFDKHLSELHHIPLSKLTKARYQEHINYLLFDKGYAESTVKRDHTIVMF